MSFTNRVQHAWNAFLNRDPALTDQQTGGGHFRRPDRPRLSRGNERSIVTSVYNRLALDVASLSIVHVKLNDNGQFNEIMKTGLNECLTVEANIDQTGRSFIHDAVLSMMDEGCVAIVPVDTTDNPNETEGCVAIVPVDTTDNPNETEGYDVNSLRTGKIISWYPRHVKVRVYNDLTGNNEDITLPKSMVAIVENPYYSVMNEPNSTMQRLIRKLNLLDVIDEQSGSGKLDLIIQLPYTIRNETKKKQAEERRSDIENQLSGSKYGIAYTDGTEKVTQLNRSIDNNLMGQITYLTEMFYSQLGITQSILNGTADEQTMLNYYSRTIEPFVSAIVDEMKRKFLTKTARTQKQSITFFRDPFKLVPVSQIAEIADKFTRNEIATSNEIRQVIGWVPSKDPKADELRNKNLSEPKPSTTDEKTTENSDKSKEDNKNE